MPPREKSAPTAKHQPQGKAIEKGHERQRVASKLNGGGQKIALGRKAPSGPVGGSGRKTNLARSS